MGEGGHVFYMPFSGGGQQGGGTTVQAGIDAANTALDKAACDKLIGATARSQDPGDLKGALKDDGVTTNNLGAPTVTADPANPNKYNVNYTLGSTDNGGIVLNSYFFPNPTSNNI